MGSATSNTLLIDADMMLYKAVLNSEVEIEWQPDIITTHLPLAAVRFEFEASLNTKRQQANADEYVLCWTHGENFRKTVDETYKANRRATNHRVKPVGFREARKWAESNHPSECWKNLEADDVLGILGTRGTYKHPVIWSGDKDLKQIAGTHLDNEGNLYEITQTEADAFFYRQCLIGDTVDGYSGCPSIGPKTAEKLIPLEGFTEASAWRVVVEQYKKKGLSKVQALNQARLARILRNTEYTFDEVQLWTPLTLATTDTEKTE